jgi:hypothetical protein
MTEWKQNPFQANVVSFVGRMLRLWSRHPVVKNGFAVIRLFFLTGVDTVKFSMRPIVFAIFTIMKNIRVIGRNAKSVKLILGKTSLNECLRIGQIRLTIDG